MDGIVFTVPQYVSALVFLAIMLIVVNFVWYMMFRAMETNFDDRLCIQKMVSNIVFMSIAFIDNDYSYGIISNKLTMYYKLIDELKLTPCDPFKKMYSDNTIPTFTKSVGICAATDSLCMHWIVESVEANGGVTNPLSE